MNKRPQPRQSALRGAHPAIPPQHQTRTDVHKPSAVSGQFENSPAQALPQSQPKAGPTHQKMTINISTELVDKAKDAFWMDRREYHSFSEWISEAIHNQVEAAKTRHDVQTLPARPRRDLPSGRPLS